MSRQLDRERSGHGNSKQTCTPQPETLKMARQQQTDRGRKGDKAAC